MEDRLHVVWCLRVNFNITEILSEFTQAQRIVAL